jgi:hypothetical protein
MIKWIEWTTVGNVAIGVAVSAVVLNFARMVPFGGAIFGEEGL